MQTTSFLSLNRKLFKKSLPLVMACFLPSLIGLVDSIYLSHLSSAAFRSFSLAIPFLSLVNAAAAALTTALNDSLIKGSSPLEIGLDLKAAVTLTFIFSALFIGVGYYSIPYVASYYALTDNLIAERVMFYQYWDWVLPSIPFQFFFALFLQQLISQDGELKGSRILIIMILVQVIVSPVLIYYFRLGIVGSAIATDISYITGCFLAGVTHYSIKENNINTSWDKSIFKKMYHQFIHAANIFFAASVFSIGAILFAKLSADIGAVAISLFGIARQFTSIFNLSSRGVCSAFMIIFSQSLHRQNISEYFKIYWSATIWVAVMFGLGACILIFFPNILILLFNSYEINIKNDARIYFLLTGFTLLIYIFPRISHVGLISLGLSYVAILQSVLKVGSGYIFALFLYKRFGIVGIALGQLIGDLITALIFVPLFLYLLAQRKYHDGEL